MQDNNINNTHHQTEKDYELALGMPITTFSIKAYAKKEFLRNGIIRILSFLKCKKNNWNLMLYFYNNWINIKVIFTQI